MPHQDAQGRWISDDGLLYWDGAAWRPTGVQPAGGAQYAPPVAGAPLPPPAGGKSAWPAVLIGCGIAFVVVLVLGIVGIFALVSNTDFQRSFCNSYTSSNPNLVCPFSPPSP
jgi:hypothetical protein